MRAVAIVTMLLLGAVAAPARADKSETTSVALAATGTGVSSAMVLAAFLIHPESGDVNQPLLIGGIVSSVITPSLGHLYSNQWLTIGMGIRGIAGALALYGLSSKQDQPCATRPNENCPEVTGTGLTLISLAAIAYIGGVAYDVRDARPAARRYNLRHAGGAALAPTAFPHGGGLTVVGRF